MMVACLLVRAGGRLLALPVAQLDAVADPGPVAPVPATEPALRGVATVRGRLVPVLSLGALLDVAPERRGDGGTMVLAHHDDQLLCLEVDAAEHVVRGEALPMPEQRSVPWARAVLEVDGALVPVVDIAALGARLAESGRA